MTSLNKVRLLTILTVLSYGVLSGLSWDLDWILGLFPFIVIAVLGVVAFSLYVAYEVWFVATLSIGVSGAMFLLGVYLLGFFVFVQSFVLLILAIALIAIGYLTDMYS